MTERHTHERFCDGCGNVIGPDDSRPLYFSLVQQQRSPVSIITTLPVERPYHFCNMGCLKGWNGERAKDKAAATV
jgi:hypothetical protein